MGELINKLWDDFNLNNYEDDRTTELIELYITYRDDLISTLNAKQKELFDEFEARFLEYHSTMEKNAFTAGFGLGTRLLSEAFSEAERARE